jgi:hypothetical protein
MSIRNGSQGAGESRKRTGTITRQATGKPFRVAGANVARRTASVAAVSRTALPDEVRISALLTVPSASTIADTLTSPWSPDDRALRG